MYTVTADPPWEEYNVRASPDHSSEVVSSLKPNETVAAFLIPAPPPAGGSAEPPTPSAPRSVVVGEEVAGAAAEVGDPPPPTDGGAAHTTQRLREMGGLPSPSHAAAALQPPVFAPVPRPQMQRRSFVPTRRGPRPFWPRAKHSRRRKRA
eukprot:gene18324-10252_t